MPVQERAVSCELEPGRSVVPLRAGHEYAVVPLEAAVAIGPHRLAVGRLGYLGVDHDDVPIVADEPTRMMLLGGQPFPEPLLMWWNYVARTRGEIITAHDDWSSGAARFGSVASPFQRIDTASPPWGSDS